MCLCISVKLYLMRRGNAQTFRVFSGYLKKCHTTLAKIHSFFYIITHTHAHAHTRSETLFMKTNHCHYDLGAGRGRVGEAVSDCTFISVMVKEKVKRMG